MSKKLPVIPTHNPTIESLRPLLDALQENDANANLVSLFFRTEHTPERRIALHDGAWQMLPRGKTPTTLGTRLVIHGPDIDLLRSRIHDEASLMALFPHIHCCGPMTDEVPGAWPALEFFSRAISVWMSTDHTLLAVEESHDGGGEQFRLRGVIVNHPVPAWCQHYIEALARAKAA